MASTVQDGDGTLPPLTVLLRAAEIYDGQPSMIAEARQFAADFLRRAHQQGAQVGLRLTQDAPLVVSELVTNAVRHAPGRCTLVLELDARMLRVTVGDTSAQKPEPASWGPARIGGHGLEIVLKLCTRVETRRTASGKTITAHLART